MNAAIVGTLARSLLLSIGGIAVSKGYIDNDTLTQIVGAVITLATAAWGVVEKLRRDPR